MTETEADFRALEELDARLRIVLPEEYQDTYEAVQPVSMGSAGLKYADDGRVAWDQMWAGFCDLAMAGGPPHKGMLLEPGSQAEIDAEPERYREVVDEICRGVMMVTQLPADPSPVPGWIRVECYSDAMAAWLLRAIVMENVAARADARMIDLPAAPAFRLEKQIKNVITVIAKTCHYWLGHIPRWKQRAIAGLFATLSVESPLVEPAFLLDRRTEGDRAQTDAPVSEWMGAAAGRPGRESAAGRVRDAMIERIARDPGLGASRGEYAGWLGVECSSVGDAIWMMRALVVSNILARREGVVLFVPLNLATDPEGARVAGSLARIHHLMRTRAARLSVRAGSSL